MSLGAAPVEASPSIWSVDAGLYFVISCTMTILMFVCMWKTNRRIPCNMHSVIKKSNRILKEFDLIEDQPVFHPGNELILPK